MNAAEKRDLWLKRILPALAIAILYAVFAAPRINDKRVKAEQEYEKLVSRGISAAALPALEQQYDSLQGQVVNLQSEDTKIHAELAGYTGFLAQNDAATTASDELAALFAEHSLRVISEKQEGAPSTDAFPKSLRDTQDWLKAAINLTGRMSLLEIHFAGTYVDTYRAMAVLANGKINALPVSLSMQEWKQAERSDQALLEWRLKLWI